MIALSESRSLGSFIPLFLQLKLNLEVPSEPATEDLIATFFHEHVHFWHSIATTYGIGRHFEVLEWIAEAVRKMGGQHDLILHGLAKPAQTSISKDGWGIFVRAEKCAGEYKR